MNIKLKKTLSAILSLVMVIGLFAGIGAPTASAKDDCGYNSAGSVSALLEAGVDAEAGRCYSINSPEDLIAFSDYINSGRPSEGVTFYTSCDINMTDAFFVPIGAKAANAFRGTFDGCGFAVLNLTATASNADDVALFGFVVGENAVIKNAGVMGTIEGGNTLAGLVANLEGGSVVNSWSAVNITGSANCGGIVGRMSGGRVENCCNFGYISADNNAGAIAGKVTDSAVIDYCYYVYYSANNACGSLSANSSANVCRFAGSSTEVLTEKIITIDHKVTDDLVVLLNEWVDEQKASLDYRQWVYDTSETGHQRVGGRYPSHRYPGYIDIMDNLYNQTSTMTALYESGQNALNGGFYSISNGEELYYLADYVNAGFLTEGATFYLTSDILIQEGSASVLQADWTAIGADDNTPFRGVFDGQGYVITGLFAAKGNHIGLFGYVDSANALIKNVGANGIFTGNDHVGGIVADLRSGAVANCWFNGSITCDNEVGGIVGSCDIGSITNCCCFCEIAGGNHTGAIVGDTTGSSIIKFCYYSANNTVAVGDDQGTVSVVLSYTESGTDFTLERSISVGEHPCTKLLNALNHWVTDLAPDNTYRHWKIDDSEESLARILGKHPTHLFPGDNSGIKQVDEPEDVINGGENPYRVRYLETATMTELYDSGADGISGGHYSINSGNEMELLSKYVNNGHSTRNITFYLTTDVSLALQSVGNDYEGWQPIGKDASAVDTSTYFRAFRGTFDGCGYTVYSMFISKNEADEVGLFGQIQEATIKNVGVVGDIVAELKCGGICGEAEDSYIYNCWTAVNIQSEEETGGIAGEINDTVIQNCVCYGAILCYGGITTVGGGIFGEANGSSEITNCYYLKTTTKDPYAKISNHTTADVIGFSYGFIGDDYVCSLEKAAQIEETTTTNLLTALNGWAAAQNNGLYSGWENSSIMITVEGATGHFPVLMPPNEHEPGLNEDYDGDYTATCSITELYSMRTDGIPGCYYSINSLEDLEAFQKYVVEGYATEDIVFFLTRDIDMSQKYSVDSERSWIPIGNVENPFRGIFDGQGYTLKYLYINSSSDDQGLFGHITGTKALVKNLGVSGVVRGNVNAGSICGDFNFGTIANCWSSCEVTALGNNAGGIVGGANMGTITNCANYGAVVNANAYGGIAGYAFNTTMEYCYYLYATCRQAYGLGSVVNEKDVQFFNGTSAACILHEKVNVEGTTTQNMLSALKLFVDAHPETNYCYWAIGNTEEYLLQGVEFFPVLLSASGTMGEKDYRQVLAYYNDEPYYSVVKAVNAANDNPDGGDVILATNVILKLKENLVPDSNVRIVTGDYTLDFKSEIKVYSMQQLDGYFIVNKDGGSLYIWDMDKRDYKLFMYAKKDADASCNSEFYGTQSLTFRSLPVKGDYPDGYNLVLHDGEFIVNPTLDSGNPHKIPAGSTITLETRATLNVAANARIRTTGGTSQIMNGGTVKIGNATLNANGGERMVGVFEDNNGIVSLPFVYRDGYTLRGWSDGINLYPAGSKADIQTATKLTAQWKIGDSADQYPGDQAYDDGDGPIYNIPITVIQSDGGSITPETIMAAKGENLSFNVSPASGYYVKNVLVDGQSVELDENGVYKFVSVSAPHTVVALFAPTTNATYYDWTNPFEDINRDTWCYDYVHYVVSAGLFNGTTETTFSPDKTMTRDMVVVVLWRLAGCPMVPDNGVTFYDVPKTNYAYDAVRWANQFGIVNGFDATTFGYGRPVTREQLITFLFRYAKNYAGDNVAAYDNVNILGYTDVMQISKGMTQPFQWGIGAGIVNGTSDTTLSPKAPCTRGQVAAILSRYCNLFHLQTPVINVDNL